MKKELHKIRVIFLFAVLFVSVSVYGGGNEGNRTGHMISAGTAHTCVLTQAGALKCWGRNGWGQLGDGTTESRATPVDVSGLSSGVIAVSAGWRHTCALTQTGGLKCWGDNEYGQIGDGTTEIRTTPVDVSGLSGGLTAISAGGEHTCALTQTGGVKCWGNNEHGQLGDGTTKNRLAPVDVYGLSSGVIAVSAGWKHTCALTQSGGVKCWGWNEYGQLGDGTTENRPTPVDVSGLSGGVIAVSAGWRYTCALTQTGGVKCWGANWSGQLGNGTMDNQDTPVDVSGLSSGVIVVATGGNHTCALTQSGGVKCWGDNEYGQIGDGTYTPSNIPQNVSGLSSEVSDVCGGVYHTCALIKTGAVKCWGWNNYGQLGDGTTEGRTIPVDVVGLTLW